MLGRRAIWAILLTVKSTVGAGLALGFIASVAACSGDEGRPERDLGLDPAPEQFQTLARSLKAACEPGYEGDPQAPAFDPNQAGPHGLVFIAADGSAHALNNAIPKSWRRESLSEIELVACVSDVQSRTIEECEYLGTPRTVDRVERFVNIRLIDVRTATVAESVSLSAATQSLLVQTTRRTRKRHPMS